MDRSERFYRIDQLLNERKVVPVQDFLDELEISLATFKRDLDYMKDRFHAPIEWDRELRGYRFAEAQANQGGPSYALPGLWFNASEIHALLTMQHLLSNLQPGLLGSHIEPLQARLRAVLGTGDHTAEEVEKRFRMVYASRRKVLPGCFQVVATGVLRRNRLKLEHFNRQTGETLVREVSPQQLVYYRENWYLDAWCHLRDGLRSFSLDAIRSAEPGSTPAKDVPKKLLRETLEAGYGIFGGTDVKWAKLRFTPERARWVAAEDWHAEQRGSYDGEGRYLLEVPYSDDRELIMDILKHGAHCEVLSPAGLRKRVQDELRKTLEAYRPG
jgi:predicted DNA-binding transcriptional regulator YafY